MRYSGYPMDSFGAQQPSSVFSDGREAVQADGRDRHAEAPASHIGQYDAVTAPLTTPPPFNLDVADAHNANGLINISELQQTAASHRRPSHPINRPLSTLAGSSTPQSQPPLSSAEHSSLGAQRSRIPRAEKDADDTSSPVWSQDITQPEYTTPATLSRLFAVQSSRPDSRSPSYNSSTDPASYLDTVDSMPLAGHLYTQGLLSGKHSDITINAFGCSYRLHRLILARAPFFNTALSGQWLESSSKDITLHPQDVDSNITKICFELALKRLYGAAVPHEESTEATGLFATGCWLEMGDLIDSSIEAILRSMETGRLNPLIRLVTNNYYGRAGDKILASAKAMLCRDGWKMPARLWDDVPADIVREIVGGDGFFVSGEWDRWVLAKKIFNRRLRSIATELGMLQRGTKRIVEAPAEVKSTAVRFDSMYRKNFVKNAPGLPDSAFKWISLYSHPDVEALQVLLDEGIHYVHLDFEHLQHIRTAKDIFGLPLMPEKVISDALWMQMELRQKVVTAGDGSMELGLSRPGENQSFDINAPEHPGSASQKGKQRASDPASPSESDDLEPPAKSWDGTGKPRKFWIPSADCNIVMGGNADPLIATPASLSMQRHASRLSGTVQPEDVQWAADFGAASADSRPLPAMRASILSSQLPSAAEVQPVSYSHFPPFRFAAEFPNPRLLKEKKRVYSRTIFYAGSHWNIYIQKVKTSKSSQLGVYLHRAKEREAEEVALMGVTGGNGGSQVSSSVDERIGLLEREMLLRRDRMPVRVRASRRGRNIEGGLAALDDPDSSGAGSEVADNVAAALPSRPRRLGDLPTSQRKSRQTLDTYLSAPSDHAGRARQSSAAFEDQRGYGDEEDDEDGDTDLDSDDYGNEDEEDEEDNDGFAPTASSHPSTTQVTRSGGTIDDVTTSNSTTTTTLPPYTDARPTIKTYFKIYSPSKGGRMLSVYESAPDRFNFSQSWGWKSSTLMLDEGMDEPAVVVGGGVGGGGGGGSDVGGGAGGPPGGVGPGGTAGAAGGVPGVPRRAEGRLRFMVVIGNV